MQQILVKVDDPQKKVMMMNKLFNLTSTFKSEAQEDGSVMVRGMASTNAFDRAGDSISADAWTKGGLGNFEKNPIILFNHDYNKPIGRATKVTPTRDGLHMEAKISKHAECAELIKDGVLGAFSVGFKVKDADYMKETDGLMIKDAELFEVSVVSVPCNQAATFSLAKSFDSETEYENFKKTFKSEEQSSSKEIDMSEETKTPEVDLEAFAKKVAEETAAKIAMKAAEQKAAEEAEAKAAEEAEAAKALEAESIKSSIKSGIETGAEKLMADIQKDMDAQKELDIKELASKYEKDLKEKTDEIEAMRNSKKSFSGRGKGDFKGYENELVQAHILGKITKKGFDTDFAKDLMEKSGVAVPGAVSLTALETTISTTFEEEVRQEMRVAPLFREVPVTSGATVLPIVPDVEPANFATTGAVSGNLLENAGASNDKFTISQKVLNAHRLISSQFIDNNTDEQVIVNFLPLIQSGLARAHAIAIDKALLVGGSGFATGLVGASGTDDTNGFAQASAAVDNGAGGTGTNIDASTGQEVTPITLMNMRAQMGKYGLRPLDVAYIIPTDGYYQLIDATGFTDVSEVGEALASKLSGLVGTVFGSPVIATDQLAQNLAASGAATSTAAIAVYTGNYVIPRLRGVNIETDYEVANQRNVIVATQSLGFEELVAGSGTNQPSIRLPYS